jgi:hypothetical protein
MSLGRLRVTDWDRALHSGPLLLGEAFAFLGPDRQAVPLLGPAPIELPGLTLDPVELPALRLAGVTSDRALYRTGRDTVSLLAFHLGRPGAAGHLEVKANGTSFARLPLLLNDGLAVVPLRDLPAGEYQVRWADAPADEPACAFTVADYRLAPLVASLLERRREGEPPRLAFRLRLETFGVAVEGGVCLELTDAGQRVLQTRAVAAGGLVESAFALSGDGPHAINVQLEADPARTATVPLPGSRAAERSPTVFSPLGVQVTGSLLPTAGCRPVRGLYLEEGAVRNTPFHLERADAAVARLLAATPAGPVCVVAVDLLDPSRRVEVRRAALAAREAIEVEVPGPLALVAIGALVGGRPWEGWAAVVRPEGLAPRIRVPERCDPGAEVTVEVETGVPEADVYLVVKDARLLSPDTPVSRLAGQIKATVEELPALAVGPVESCAIPAPFDPAEVLVRQGLVTPEQVEEARQLCRWSRIGLQDALVNLDFTTQEAIDAALAREPGVGFLNLDTLDIPPEVIELLPESVARENGVLPVASHGRLLIVAAGDPTDRELLAKLQFILNRDVRAVLARRREIVEAINRHYGQYQTESVDSYLAEELDISGFEDEDFDDEDFDDEDFDDEDLDDSDLALALDEEADDPADAGSPAPARRPPMTAPTRAAEPEVLFAGLLSAQAGRAAVTLRPGDSFADYIVEAFVVAGLDWAGAEARFRAEKSPFVALDLPAFVHPDDAAPGRVHAGTPSGRLRVRLRRDGVEVPLCHEGRPLAPGAEVRASRAELTFSAGPGEYYATVEDPESGALDTTEKRVETPGRLRTRVRALRFLQPGEEVARSADPSLVALAVLPGLERPFKALVEATADYGHSCCEQTAAKLLAGCAMYTLAGDEERRQRAAAVIEAGVRRQASMWLRGRGFKMYPERPDTPDTYFGPLAARYLWDLDLLRRAGPLAPALNEAVGRGLEMARDATAAYRLSWPPQPNGPAECYAVLRFGDDRSRRAAVAPARSHAARALEAVKRTVSWRAAAAYAAACLLRVGAAADGPLALKLADAVVAALNEAGRLYSTLDSVAAIALLTELRAAGVVSGAGAVEVDGRRLDLRAAGGAVAERVRALEGVTAVEVTREVEESWESYAGTIPLAVALERDGRASRTFAVGDALELRVTLEEGYRTGDLLWVCLPDALARLLGGGQVKRFAVDFAGSAEVRVPLAATAPTRTAAGVPGPQHFAVCVRNMFDEERAGNPGLLQVVVAPPLTSKEAGHDRRHAP